MKCLLEVLSETLEAHQLIPIVSDVINYNICRKNLLFNCKRVYL
jgi:hypothetical protein